jgi:uncharacterized membrane protein
MSTSNVETSKILCAIGALLLFISFVPVVGIIGLILLILGLKGLSERYNDPGIYQHAVKGVIFGIIAIIALAVISFTGFFGGALIGVFTGGIAGAITAVIMFVAALVVAFIFYVLMAINFRRAFNILEQKTGEHLFHTAGTLLYIGALLTIIVVGLFLVWIAWLILAIAFFTMKPAPTQPTYQQQPYGYTQSPPTPAPTKAATQFCPNCGAQVQPGQTFCPNCGKPLPPN